MRRQRTTVLVGCAALLIAAACSGDGSSGATTTVPSTSAPSTTVAADDGVLRLGVLAPLTGNGARIGRSLLASVEIAVAEVNDAGGVLGEPVQLRVADEGADIATAAAAADELVREEVDAIVGPTSSTVTLNVLETFRRDGILACSPTATALALDGFPDDGLFFRTVPSDAVQAEAIAEAVDRTGRSSAGLLFVDDAYGRPFAERVRRALADRSIEVSVDVPFDAADPAADVDATVQAVAAAQVVVVIAGPDSGARVVSALAEATPAADTPIVVNDAMRTAAAADVIGRLPSSALDRIIGVAPSALPEDAEFLRRLAEAAGDVSSLFAVNAYDCVNLIALAASSVGSSEGAAVAAAIPNIATRGSSCAAFGPCATALVEGRNVDYDGPSGMLQLGSGGDPSIGRFDVFRYRTDGTDVEQFQLTVGM